MTTEPEPSGQPEENDTTATQRLDARLAGHRRSIATREATINTLLEQIPAEHRSIVNEMRRIAQATGRRFGIFFCATALSSAGLPHEQIEQVLSQFGELDTSESTIDRRLNKSVIILKNYATNTGIKRAMELIGRIPEANRPTADQIRQFEMLAGRDGAELSLATILRDMGIPDDQTENFFKWLFEERQREKGL